MKRRRAGNRTRVKVQESSMSSSPCHMVVRYTLSANVESATGPRLTRSITPPHTMGTSPSISSIPIRTVRRYVLP